MPACPPALRYVWNWFNEIRPTINGNGFGPNMINHQDIAFWRLNMRRHPSPWDVETILAIDRLWLKAWLERPKK
jgi:hypothetical protein